MHTCTSAHPCDNPNHNHCAIYAYIPPADPLPSDGPGNPIPGDEDYEDRANLVDDLANVLTLVEREYVGRLSIRHEIRRVLDRYADEELVRIEQLNADRQLITGMVRDAFGISLDIRAAIREDSQAVDLVCGF